MDKNNINQSTFEETQTKLKTIEKNQVEEYGNWIYNCGTQYQIQNHFDVIEESFLMKFIQLANEQKKDDSTD